MAMNKQRRTANLNNIVTYDTLKNVTLLADLTVEGLTGAGFVKADVNGLLSVDTGAYLPMPSQTGNSGKFLTTDGVNLSWGAVPQDVNIYNNDGTLTANRTLSTGAYKLAIQWNSTFTQYNTTPTTNIFQVKDSAGSNAFSVWSNGSVAIGVNANSAANQNGYGLYVDPGFNAGIYTGNLYSNTQVRAYGGTVTLGDFATNITFLGSNNSKSYLSYDITNGFVMNAGQYATTLYNTTIQNNAGSGIRLFGSTANVVIGGTTFTDAGYKLDVQGTVRATGDGTFNDITIGQTGGGRYIKWSLNDVWMTSGSTNIANFSASGVNIPKTLTAGNGTTISEGTELSGYTRKLTFPASVWHTQTHFILSQSDSNYGGNTTQPGSIWIYPGKNTTNNSFGNIYFAHDGTESRGNVSIGSSATPVYRLDVTGTGRFTGALYSNTCVYATGNQSDGALNVSNPNSSGFNTVIINRADVTNCFGNIGFIDRKTGALNRGFSIGIGMSGDPTWSDGDFLFGNYTGSGGYNQSARIYNATGNWRIGATGSDSGFKLDVFGPVRLYPRGAINGGFEFTFNDVYNIMHSGSHTFLSATHTLMVGAGSGSFTFLGVNKNDNITPVLIGYNSWQSNISSASAILDVRSTTGGFLQPRMTTTQRDAIATPATGLQVYNTTTNTNDYYNGTSWNALAVGNIYTTDGTLTGPRTISGGGNGLTFAVSGIAINHTTTGIPLTISRHDDGNVALTFINTGYSSSSGGYILVRDNGNYLINSVSQDLWLGIGGSGNWNNPSIALKKTTGNVVVGGTTDAGYKLDVQGTGRFTGNVRISDGNWGEQITIGSSASINWQSVTINGGGLSPNTFIRGYGGNTFTNASGLSGVGGGILNVIAASATTGDIFAVSLGDQVGDNTTLRFVVRPDGEIQVANGAVIVPSSRNYTVGGNITLRGGSPRGDVPNSIGGNAIIAGGLGTGTGTPGDVIISTATPTTSGTTLQTLTQRMWVKGDNGNVGIGASPNAAYKLDVAGTVRISNAGASGTRFESDKIFHQTTVDMGASSVNFGSHLYAGGQVRFNSSGEINSYIKIGGNNDSSLPVSLPNDAYGVYIGNKDMRATAADNGSQHYFNIWYNDRTSNGVSKAFNIRIYGGQSSIDYGDVILQHDGTNSRGNVGIGMVPSIANKLDVAGTINSSTDSFFNGIRIGHGQSNQVFNFIVGSGGFNVNTTGNFNTAVGINALEKNTTGSVNCAVGGGALGNNTSGYYNLAVGISTLVNLSSGSYNTGIGVTAGEKISGGTTNLTTANNSIFIGYGTKALADSQTNQIVIGYNETGLGSNTTIIGNSSTVTTAIRGRLLLGTTTDTGSYQLDVNGAIRATSSVTNNIAVFSGVEPNINITALGGSNSAALFLSPSAGFNGGIHNRTGGGIEFYTGATPSLSATITATNNLLVGTGTDTGQRLQVFGNAQVNHTYNHTTGNYTTGTTSYTNVTTAASSSYTSGMFYGAFQSYYRNNIQGSVTVPNSAVMASQFNGAQIVFSSANTVVTMTQGGSGIRAYAGQILQFSFDNAQASCSVSHVAGIQILSPYYQSSNNPTITNYYGLLLNNSAEYSGNITITNRWAVYQDGASDNNYFKGKVIIGSTNTVGISPLNVKDLPTSSAGLSTGDIWSDGGTLKVV